jgi:hypothetical protein
VQLHHPVTGSANRTIGKHDPDAQSVEADPKKTVRLVGVLEYTLQPLQPTIEHKNERRKKWSLEAQWHRVASLLIPPMLSTERITHLGGGS